MTGHTLGNSRFVTLVDGRRLHYRTQGTGVPTVVFEAGMGFSGSYWGLVQPIVGNETTVVTYDRAGTGKSDWDSEPRTLDRIGDDLSELLNHLQGPFILVGHSWGGPIVRRFASRREHDIQGLVLVDQSDERDSEYFTAHKPQTPNAVQRVTRLLMHTVGLRMAGTRLLRNMPTDVRREVMWGDLARSGFRVGQAEFQQFIPELKLLLREPDAYPGIPVTIISGTEPKSTSKGFRKGLVMAHRESASAMEDGKFVEAPKSGHYPPLTEPTLVANEILELVRGVQEKHQSRHGS